MPFSWGGGGRGHGSPGAAHWTRKGRGFGRADGCLTLAGLAPLPLALCMTAAARAAALPRVDPTRGGGGGEHRDSAGGPAAPPAKGKGRGMRIGKTGRARGQGGERPAGTAIHAGGGGARGMYQKGVRGGKSVCTKNGLIRFSQRYISFHSAMVPLVRVSGGGGGSVVPTEVRQFGGQKRRIQFAVQNGPRLATHVRDVRRDHKEPGSGDAY